MTSRRKILLSILVILTLWPPGLSQAAEYFLKARVFLNDTRARLIEVWIPLPLEDESQEVLSLSIKAPGPFLILEDPEYRNRYLYLTLEEGGVEISYEARIRRREFQPGPGTPPSSRLLLPDRLVPLEPFRNLAQELARGKNSDLARLKAFYDFVVRNLRYDKSGTGWGRGDALFACSARRGNCTDFHSLLMALARVVNIPVLFEIGLPVPPRGGEIRGYHCWLKAYVEGKVWGLDASEAAKNPAKRAYFFGHLDERRILLARGRDLLLAPAQHGERLNFIYQAYAEADLRPAPALVRTVYQVNVLAN